MIETIHAYAKVNIFLKITGYRDGYHTISSRFMKVSSLYDIVTFVPEMHDTFMIEGCNDIELNINTIYRAFVALEEATGNPDLSYYFRYHKVVVQKNIPAQAGLGGGSSDAAAFMRLANHVCGLKLTPAQLAKIGSSIGSDIPFFIYDYSSANVSGFGEIVEPFEEQSLPLEIYTPPLGCSTSLVYSIFHDNFLPSSLSPTSFSEWEKVDSANLLRSYSPSDLNDLYPAARLACPALENHAPSGWFFSGSGSSFFWPLAQPHSNQ